MRQTMAHRSMHVDHWIEIDKEYEWYLSEKAKVIEEHGTSTRLPRVHILVDHQYLGKDVLDSLPENDEACGELLAELAAYLPKRYPTLFRREGKNTIVNLVTGYRYDNVGAAEGVDALRAISWYVLLFYLNM